MFNRPSPSLVVSLFALVIALGGAGYSATGGNFILGKTNTAATQTALSASLAGIAFKISNPHSAAKATALRLNVASGHPPFTVNSSGKVALLNADRLDDLDSTKFVRTALERWRYVGDPGEPAFLNGWSNFDSATTNHLAAQYQHAAFRLDANGFVHIRGFVKGGTAQNPIFLLPRPYCPYFYKIFPAGAAGNTVIHVTVSRREGSGPCAVYSNFGTNVWVSLEGVSYPSYLRDAIGAS